LEKNFYWLSSTPPLWSPNQPFISNSIFFYGTNGKASTDIFNYEEKRCTSHTTLGTKRDPRKEKKIFEITKPQLKLHPVDDKSKFLFENALPTTKLGGQHHQRLFHSYDSRC
jgi:hypothetical protein